MEKAYEAKGFPKNGDHQFSFVNISPAWPLSGPGEVGNHRAHVGVDYYMTPAQARTLAADLLVAADTAEGVTKEEAA